MIPDRLWLAVAKGMPVGDSAKIIHKGCGNRASMFVKNEDDRWWCYCHRCRDSSSVMKKLQRIKQTAGKKTGWMPDTLVPLLQAIIDEPYNFKELFTRHDISRYTSLCTYSPETKRIYFPDESASYLGLDATLQANARFYSPKGRAMATSCGDTTKPLVVTQYIGAYLSAISGGYPAVVVMNKAAHQPALAEVSCMDYTGIICKDERSPLPPQFINSIKALE